MISVLDLSPADMRRVGRRLLAHRQTRLAFAALLAPAKFRPPPLARRHLPRDGVGPVRFAVEERPWWIGLVEADRPGYWPQPTFGFFATEREAHERAAWLTKAFFGTAPREAIEIVLTSMGASRALDGQERVPA